MAKVQLCWVVIVSVVGWETSMMGGSRPWLLQRRVGLLEFVGSWAIDVVS